MDGTAMWVDTTAMTGAETGARAGVGAWTGEGREAETGIWAKLMSAPAAATWLPALTDTGDKTGAGAVTCVGAGVDVKPVTGLKACAWI